MPPSKASGHNEAMRFDELKPNLGINFNLHSPGMNQNQNEMQSNELQNNNNLMNISENQDKQINAFTQEYERAPF